MKYFIGLDLSLQSTGLVILNEKGKIVKQELIKSKKDGEKPVDELRRLMQIREEIFRHIDETKEIKTNDTLYYAIEGLAFAVKNTTSLVQLAALNYMIREWIEYNEDTFIIVYPTSLKKFITGTGNAKKDVMMMTIYKNYGETFTDDNICDAYSLSVLLMSLINNAKSKNKFQSETIDLLKKQL